MGFTYSVQKAWQLGTREKKDYSWDVASEMSDADTITTVIWIIDPDDGSIIVTDNPDPLGTGKSIGCTIETPKAATSYKVLPLVTLANSKKFALAFGIGGVDKLK